MTLTASDVSSLAESLTAWEYAEYCFAGLVTLACFGEFVADFTNWFTKGVEQRKRRLAKFSTLVLVGALALELVCLAKTNSLSGRLIGSLNELATRADEKARKALGDSSAAITQSGQATTKAGLAEQASERAVGKSEKAEATASNAMGLARDTRREADSFEKDIALAKEKASNAEKGTERNTEKLADRHLTVEQQERIAGKLKPFARMRVNLRVVGGNGETITFANEIAATLGPNGAKMDRFRICGAGNWSRRAGRAGGIQTKRRFVKYARRRCFSVGT